MEENKPVLKKEWKATINPSEKMIEMIITGETKVLKDVKMNDSDNWNKFQEMLSDLDNSPT